VFWKWMAMGLESEQNAKDPVLKAFYEGALHEDQKCSPGMSAIMKMADIAIPLYNKRGQKRIDIEVVKG